VAGRFNGTTEPNLGDVAMLVFKALRVRCPSLLEQLRDDDETNAVETWARENNLDCPVVIEFLTAQREYWRRYPQRGLLFGGIVYATVHLLSATENTWVHDHLNQFSLPDPRSETLAECRTRVERLYLERAALQTKRRRLQETALNRHCDWFAQVQVLGKTPSSIAGAEWHNRRHAVQLGIDRIAKLLQVKPRRRPLGRPRLTH